MSIDDPIRAAEALIASDGRQQSAITELVAAAIENIGIPGSTAINSFLETRRAENRELLVTVLRDEMNNLRCRVTLLAAEHERFLRTDFVELVADGFRKAENIRDRERIVRIGKILSAAAEAGPSRNCDDTEEMMRIAVDISDSDVAVLKAIESRTGSPVTRNPPGGQAFPLAAGTYLGPFSEFPVEVSGLPPAEIQSSCFKLQSFGLASIDTETRWGDHKAFRLLPKGANFMRYIIAKVP